MKKILIVLMMGLLLIGTTVFAADGDLIVDNQIGAGTTTPNERVTVNGVLSLSEQTDAPGATLGYGKLYVVSSAAAQPSTNDKLILHMDGVDASTVFTDSSFNNYAVTPVGNTQISTTQNKSGGASGYFDGYGDYLTIPDSEDWNFGGEDFTIDFWMRSGDVSRGQTIFGQSIGTGYVPINVQMSPNGELRLNASTTGASWDIVTGALVGTLSLSTWTHIAIVRNGNYLYAFQDGIIRSTTDVAGKSFWNSSAPLYIGTHDYSYCSSYSPSIGNLCTFYNGYIDEFRISKGIARWTGNFTPPSGSSVTKPILYFKDSAGNVTLLTN